MADRRVWCGWLGLVLLLTSGCGGDPAAKRVRDLCIANKPDSAYALAALILADEPRNMDVWCEFARAALEQSRNLAIEDSEQSVELLIQGAVICAAVHRNRQGELGEAWAHNARRATQEVWKQVNTVITTCGKQSGAALYLKQQRDRPTVPGMIGDPASRAHMRFEELRQESRYWIELAAVMGQFARLLPEASSETGNALFSQLDDALHTWSLELELDSRLTVPLHDKAAGRVVAAVEKAAGDLQELGYFMPGTILENGVFS